MNKDEVLVSADELRRLKACEVTLYAFQEVVGLCPNCEKAMLCYGYVCPHCGYDDTYSVKKWKQIHDNEN